MTPKEKAQELVNLFTFSCRECDFKENAKQSALIAVDEIIKNQLEGDFLPPNMKGIAYWKEVKQEIIKFTNM